jgi:hypothetical protein
MRFESAGLLREFQSPPFVSNPYHCLRQINLETSATASKKGNKRDNKKPLTLKGLSGAFLILAIGYGLAILVFLMEIIGCSRFKNRKTFNQQQGVAKSRRAIAVSNVLAIALLRPPAADTN